MKPTRDTIAVCTSSEYADAIRARGFYAVHVGGDGCPDAMYLQQNWGRITCRNPSAVVFGPPDLAEAVQALCYQTQVNNNTGSRRSRRWVEFMLRNIHHIAEQPTALSLANKLRDVPCFIVGAGPSLSKNAELLKQAAGKGIVITVNSASRVVRGQVVLTVESNPIMAKLEPRDSVKVYSITADPQCIADGTGPFMPIWTGEIGWVCDKLTGLHRVAVSGSGTTGAVSLAHLWGCSPIVLVGQDLAYTDGRVYAPETGFAATIGDSGAFAWDDRSKGLPRPGNPLPESEELMRVVGWDGGEVLSGPCFVQAIRWLASAAEHCNSDGIVTINATEGGAAVPGWVSTPLGGVLAELPRKVISPKEIRMMAGPPPVTRERLREWLKHEAADQLLEPWALPKVRDLLDEFRQRAPHRVPVVEAVARWRFRRKLDRVIAESRRELEAMT